MSGVQKNNNGDEAILIKNLRDALPLLIEADIVGLIEPINSYSVPKYFLNSYELGRLIAAI